MTVFFSSAAAPRLGCGQLRILAAVGGAFLTVGPGQNLTLALRSCERAVVLAGGGAVFDGPSSGLAATKGLLAEHLGV